MNPVLWLLFLCGLTTAFHNHLSIGRSHGLIEKTHGRSTIRLQRLRAKEEREREREREGEGEGKREEREGTEQEPLMIDIIGTVDDIDPIPLPLSTPFDWSQMTKENNYIWYLRNFKDKQKGIQRPNLNPKVNKPTSLVIVNPNQTRLTIFLLVVLFVPLTFTELFFAISRQFLCVGAEWSDGICAAYTEVIK